MLLKVCERKAECASNFLLADNHPHVEAELKRLQIEAQERKDVGYNMAKPMDIAKNEKIPWGAFPPSALLASSRWFKTLTIQQKDTLCFSMVHQPGNHFFRDVRPSFGRTRVSSRGDEDQVIASTAVPTQTLMVFDDKNKEREPRFVLGREIL